jgi:hypothetical protein
LTKPLAKGKFEMLREKLGVMENTFLHKEGVLVYLLLGECLTLAVRGTHH